MLKQFPNANNGEQSESIEPVAAPARKPAEPAKSQPVEPDPKKRGRPSGAKDREPRRKKLIIVEEPVSEPKQTAAIPEKPSPQAAPAPQPVVHEREELSPRTLIREASRRIVELKRMEANTRRSRVHDVYSRNLHTLS